MAYQWGDVLIRAEESHPVHRKEGQPLYAAPKPAANADALLDALRQIAEWPDGGNRYGQGNIKRFAQATIDSALQGEQK